MISGKKGVIVCHMGNATEGMTALFKATDDGTLPASHLIPTHVSRNEKLLEEGIRWIKELKRELGNLDNVCVSTDGLGSLPVFDKQGNLKELKASPVDGLLKTFKGLLEQGFNIEEALKPICTVPAKALGFP